MNPQILIESCRLEPHTRNYHANSTLITYKGAGFYFPLSNHDVSNMKRIGEVGREVVDLLASQRGIVFVFLDPYMLFLVKGKLFGWEEIEKGILLAIGQIFGETKEGIEIKRQKCFCYRKENIECLLRLQYHKS